MSEKTIKTELALTDSEVEAISDILNKKFMVGKQIADINQQLMNLNNQYADLIKDENKIVQKLESKYNIKLVDYNLDLANKKLINKVNNKGE